MGFKTRSYFDGGMLANLMIDYEVGVSLEEAYEIKRVDSDYFNEA
jgi:restriction system protein